jgi:hypothetical protein
MKIHLQTLVFLAALTGSSLMGQTGASAPATPTPAATIDSTELQKLRADLSWARKVLADWPDLGRYHDENARMAAPSANESRVVFMGDSITDFWGRQRGTFFRASLM